MESILDWNTKEGTTRQPVEAVSDRRKTPHYATYPLDPSNEES
jgi:hypothetical protein